MKSISHIIWIWLACAIVLSVGAGCRHSEIGYPSRDMAEIHLMLESEGVLHDSIDGLTVTLFPRESDLNRWVYELPGTVGGDVTVPCGNYDLLAYNNGPNNIYYKGTDRFETYEATTRQIASSPSTGSALKRHAAPDPVYSAIATEIDLTPCCVSYTAWEGGIPAQRKDCRYGIVRGRLRLITPRVTCIIGKLGDTSQIAGVHGIIGGMHDGILIASGEPEGDEVEMAFDFEVADSTSITSTFYIFGRVDSAPNLLYLFIALKSGETKMFKADVTAIMDATSDPMDIVICLDGPDLSHTKPSEPDTPGAFDPSVSPWQEIIINLTN